MNSFARRHPWWTRAAALSVLLLLALAGWVRWRMQGPYRDYRVEVSAVSGGPESASERLQVGVGVRNVTPDLDAFDTWQDVDRNSRFEPAKGDTWQDRNGNGDFDFVWLGGFNANRPAQGVQDPLWARALAFRHRATTVALVSIDCVGLTHERFIAARLKLRHSVPELAHVVFSSTHTHNSPDTMGIWSYRPLPSKFNDKYVEWVLERAIEAVVEAVRTLQPADVVVGAVDLPPEGFVRDSRSPTVVDRVLGAAQFLRAGTGETLATLVSWGNHPEAMCGGNPLISSDFPHFLREAMEKGLAGEGAVGMKGFGAPCVYLQGPVGGLMTPLGLEVPDRDGSTVHRENGVGKTRALGENLALRAAAMLRGANAQRVTDARIAVVSSSVFVPIEGTFKYPIMLGLIHPGWFGGQARTEVGAWRVAGIEMLTIPGEIYPEIVDGGVESPDGADFPGAPVEVPPLRTRMRGRVNLVANLANDEVGYIIPRTQWDTRAPFTYGRQDAPYGEENSGGPSVAGILHAESLKALDRLHALLGDAK
ncbi:MAG: hypothetical protein IT580_18800 [Verrucomicrobiales bacterium]|nr:hypothetical protein [Verrucomicrobiales bacterium]